MWDEIGKCSREDSGSVYDMQPPGEVKVLLFTLLFIQCLDCRGLVSKTMGWVSVVGVGRYDAD